MMSNPVSSKRPVKLALCGACMSGNMGGQALYISMVESLEESLGDVEVTVLSKYPRDDAAACRERGWRMVQFSTLTQLIYTPIVLLLWLLRMVGIPRAYLAVGPISAYATSDILVDLSGISFTDDRSITGLIINSFWLLPAIATGIPYVKASQTMGPFTRLPVRLASGFFLTKAAALVARGARSAGYLRKLFPDRRIYELPDVAFALAPAPREQVAQAIAAVGLDPAKKYCVVGPSLVVENLVKQSGQSPSYPEQVAKAVDRLIELSGCPVILIPHERAHTGSASDDLSTCREVFARLQRSDMVRILDEHHSAAVLKGIIAGAEVAVGSRFHFLVAAMSSNVPGLAIAWSHKYYEMMQMVGQEEFVVNYRDLDETVLLAKTRELWANSERLRAVIAAKLPGVIAGAKSNAKIVSDSLHRFAG